MDASFELFDHTADLGVRVRAAKMAELVAPAVGGLYAAIGVCTHAEAVCKGTLEFKGDDPAVLLRDLLAELLYIFERDALCAVHSEVLRFDEARLIVSVQLAPMEAGAVFDREVKAVTYHGLALRKIDGGYEAEYIVDI